MSKVEQDRLYTKSHEWVKVCDGYLEIGLTDHAQESLGDIAFVELPEEGDTLTAGEALGVVESVKTLSDVYAPVSGEVSEINSALLDTPEMLNEEPYGAGWLVRVKGAGDKQELESLLDHAAYAASLDE